MSQEAPAPRAGSRVPAKFESMLALLLCIAHPAARPVVRSVGVQLPAPPAAPAIHQLEQQAARDAEVAPAYP